MPIHQHERLKKIKEFSRSYEQEFGEEPRADEIAAHFDRSEDEIRDVLNAVSGHGSLDAPMGDGPNADTLHEILPDHQVSSVENQVVGDADELVAALDRLAPDMHELLALRFGLGGTKAHTLREIADKNGITCEAVRQQIGRATSMLRTYLEPDPTPAAS